MSEKKSAFKIAYGTNFMEVKTESKSINQCQSLSKMKSACNMCTKLKSKWLKQV